MSDTVHVVPASDTVPHHTDGSDCPCEPQTQAVFREDGSNGWLVTHQRQSAPLPPTRSAPA